MRIKIIIYLSITFSIIASCNSTAKMFITEKYICDSIYQYKLFIVNPINDFVYTEGYDTILYYDNNKLINSKKEFISFWKIINSDCYGQQLKASSKVRILIKKRADTNDQISHYKKKYPFRDIIYPNDTIYFNSFYSKKRFYIDNVTIKELSEYKYDMNHNEAEKPILEIKKLKFRNRVIFIDSLSLKKLFYQLN
ncbi:hypothetical protein [Wenyingzhuangia sp. IMCC45574]